MAPTIPTRRFANHPGAKEASADAVQYKHDADHNPALRGLPLLIVSAMYVCFVAPVATSLHSGLQQLTTVQLIDGVAM